jgi:hypothetical protein
MFVSQQGGRLSMVRQDEHMLQTAALAARWTRDWFIDELERDILVEAMSLHDAGWREADDEVLYDSEAGRPVNFTSVGFARHSAFYRSGYELALSRADGAGLLVGMHWIGLYNSRFGLEPSLNFPVSDDQRELQRELIASNEQEWVLVRQRMWSPESPLSDFEERIWRQYEVFQLLDRISIAVCMNDLGMPKSVPVGRARLTGGPDRTSVELTIAGDGRVLLDPFPFDTEFTAPVKRSFRMSLTRPMANCRMPLREHQTRQSCA